MPWISKDASDEEKKIRGRKSDWKGAGCGMDGVGGRLSSAGDEICVSYRAMRSITGGRRGALERRRGRRKKEESVTMLFVCLWYLIFRGCLACTALPGGLQGRCGGYRGCGIIAGTRLQRMKGQGSGAKLVHGWGRGGRGGMQVPE